MRETSEITGLLIKIRDGLQKVYGELSKARHEAKELIDLDKVLYISDASCFNNSRHPEV